MILWENALIHLPFIVTRILIHTGAMQGFQFILMFDFICMYDRDRDRGGQRKRTRDRGRERGIVRGSERNSGRDRES